MKSIKKLIIAAVLMCSAMLLVACGGETEYKVTVKDALGNTYGAGAVVEFYDGDERVAMQTCDENGVATKSLEKGNYDVKINFTDKNVSVYYDEETAKVTSSKTEIEVIVSNAIAEDAEPTIITVDAEEYEAYDITTGCTYLELNAGEMNYVLYTPTEAGTYEFAAGEADVTLGYYGSPYFVQANSIAEVTDGKFSVSIKESMISSEGAGTTVMVIGIEAGADTDNCILTIQRTGDAEYTIDDEPWTVYETTAQLSAYTLPAGASLVDFDVTASGYTVVYNEADGYYHLNTADGPLVVVYLTEDPSVAYVPCFKNILDRSSVNKYFYDEGGNFVKKEKYDDCLLEYFDYADQTVGVYPLTEDLKYIIQSRGEYVGWWDSESPDFIFKDMDGNPISGLNTEIAWLFMCAYVQ